MDPREELQALRRMAELEAKAGSPAAVAPSAPARTSADDSVLSHMAAEFKSGIFPSVAFGGRQTLDAAAQLAARGAEKIAPDGMTPTFRGMREDTEAVNADALKSYQKNFDPRQSASNAFARGVGQVLSVAPLTPAAAGAGFVKSLLSGAGIGAASGALSPVYELGDFWGEKGKQVAFGGGLGALFGGIGGALGRGGVTPQAKELLDAGVNVPPGRSVGGIAGRLEEGLESIPVAGDMLKGAHRRSVLEFNTATANKVLEPLGKTVDKSGREAVVQVKQHASKAYNSVLDRIKIVQFDDTFVSEGNKIAAMSSELGEGAQKQFMNILKNRLFSKVTPAGTMSAQTMKQVDSQLGRLAEVYRRSSDENMRGMGMALHEVQASMRRNLERVAGPELAGELQAANKVWAGYVRLRDASTRAGSHEGVFSPAALRSAVQKADKGGFGDGDAMLQKWAEAGEKVLGPKVPDSGTPFRLMGAAGLGGLLLDPHFLTAGTGLALASTRPGQAALRKFLEKGPGAAPSFGLLAGPLSTQLLGSQQ
jgi:hypothetical protein